MINILFVIAWLVIGLLVCRLFNFTDRKLKISTLGYGIREDDIYICCIMWPMVLIITLLFLGISLILGIWDLLHKSTTNVPSTFHNWVLKITGTKSRITK